MKLFILLIFLAIAGSFQGCEKYNSDNDSRSSCWYDQKIIGYWEYLGSGKIINFRSNCTYEDNYCTAAGSFATRRFENHNQVYVMTDKYKSASSISCKFSRDSDICMYRIKHNDKIDLDYIIFDCYNGLEFAMVRVNGF